MLCLFANLLNKLAACARGVFLQRMLNTQEILLYAENVEVETSETVMELDCSGQNVCFLSCNIEKWF